VFYIDRKDSLLKQLHTHRPIVSSALELFSQLCYPVCFQVNTKAEPGWATILADDATLYGFD